MAAAEAPWLRRERGLLVVCVHVQPGARHTELAGTHGGSLKIRVHAPALEDRANAELIAFVAQRLGIAPRHVTLVSGARSREKRLAIGADCDPMRLLA